MNTNVKNALQPKSNKEIKRSIKRLTNKRTPAEREKYVSSRLQQKYNEHIQRKLNQGTSMQKVKNSSVNKYTHRLPFYNSRGRLKHNLELINFQSPISGEIPEVPYVILNSPIKATYSGPELAKLFKNFGAKNAIGRKSFFQIVKLPNNALNKARTLEQYEKLKNKRKEMRKFMR